ncbi:MAG: hypothetical protein Q9171_005548 [Xanthocarpia ochracea]
MDSAQSMMNLPAMEPPVGVTSDFVDPVSHDRSTIAFHTTLISLMTIFMAMRLYTRHFINHWLAWDDSQRQGFGRHLWDIRAIDLVGNGNLLQIIFVIQLFYIPTITVLKVSFLLFFERVFFPNKTLKYLTRGGMIVIVLFSIGIFLKSVWQCIPVQKVYQPTMPGTCGDGYVTPYVSGVFNVISDFYILFLPLPFIWQLKMNMKRKIRVMAVFSVGLFVLEVDIGIICACSLALPAFIDRYGPKLSPLLLKTKIYSYFSTASHGGSSSGGPQTHGSNIPMSFHHKGIPTSSQSSDVLRSDHQSEQREGHEKGPAFGGVKTFGTTARGDRHNLAFETNVQGGGWTGNEDVESTHPEGKIVKRVELFQTYPRTNSERSLWDEERGGGL